MRATVDSPAAIAAPATTPAKAEPPVNRIEQLLKTISASRLSGWLSCRLKFFFRYVQQIPKPPTAALHVGSVVHEVLKAWNKARWRKEPFQVEVFQEFFNQQWTALQAGKAIEWEEEEAGHRGQAWSLLTTYFTETPIKADERPQAVEVPVEADLPGLPTLVGIIDLVRAGGRIVDFKTAGKTPTAAHALHQHELQLSAYGLLYREATGSRESGLELHHLVKLKTPKLVITSQGPVSPAQETRLLRAIASYVAGLQRQDFVPAPGLQCLACEYFGECRASDGKEAYAPPV